MTKHLNSAKLLIISIIISLFGFAPALAVNNFCNIDNSNNEDSGTVTKVNTGSGGGGGGGGFIPAFQEPKNGFRINYEIIGSMGSSTVVRLVFDAGQMTRMAISNDSSLTNATQKPFQTSTTWTLTPGSLPKKVYIQFFDQYGQGSKVIDLTIAKININDNFLLKGKVLGVKVTRLDELVQKLKYNSSGLEVREMQVELQKLGYFKKNFKPTLWYGQMTRDAVKKYLANK